MKELKIVRNLLDELNDKIIYCHWKSNQHFINALKGIDDLDILVDKAQSNELIQILHKLNFKHFYTPIARTYVGIEDYLGFDEETGIIVHLHLHYKLVIGEKHLKGFHFPIEKNILNNRRYDEEFNVYFSSYFDELNLLILRLGMKNRKRDLFKRKVFEKSTFEEFKWLKDNCDNFEENLINVDYLTERIKKKVKAIYSGNYKWSTMNKLKKYLYKDLDCYSQGNGIYNTLKRNINELKRIRMEILKRFFPSKYSFLRRRSATGGCIIAFLGSDGAGKSSSIKEIRKWLLKVMDVRYCYLGSGDGNSSILRKPLKILKNLGKKIGIIKESNNFNDNSLNEQKDVKHSMNLMRKLWIYTLSKERIKKLNFVSRCRLRGYVVLTDRYPQNEFDGLCDGPKLRNQRGITAKKEKESFRRATLCYPDLVIKLIVSPEEAQKRKPNEINLETSKNLTDRVKKIQFSSNTKSVMINADEKQEVVLLNIKKAIWDII